MTGLRIKPVCNWKALQKQKEEEYEIPEIYMLVRGHAVTKLAYYTFLSKLAERISGQDSLIAADQVE